MKRLTMFLLLFTLSFSLLACSSNSSSEDNGDSGSDGDNSGDDKTFILYDSGSTFQPLHNTLSVGESPVINDLSFTAYHYLHGDITSDTHSDYLVITDNINSSVAGDYTIEYYLEDENGDVSNSLVVSYTVYDPFQPLSYLDITGSRSYSVAVFRLDFKDATFKMSESEVKSYFDESQAMMDSISNNQLKMDIDYFDLGDSLKTFDEYVALEDYNKDVKDFAFADVSSFPSNFDSTKYDLIVNATSMDSTMLRNSAYAADFYNIELFKDRFDFADSAPILDRLKYVAIGINETNFTHERTTDSESHIFSDYIEGIDKLTRVACTLTHEIIHAFGYAGHANGFHPYSGTQEQYEEFLVDPSAPTDAKLEYGDLFSIMGSNDYSIGLSPLATEILGTAKNTYNVSDDDNVTISTDNFAKVFLGNYRSASGELVHRYLYINYHSGSGYHGSLNIPGFTDNTKGIMLRYVERVAGNVMGSSILLDAYGDIFDTTHALLPNRSFSFLNVVIDDVYVDGVDATFTVKYN